MRLSREFKMTLPELGERMSYDEFVLRLADYEMRPWGEDRLEVSLAILGAANSWDKDVKVEDFLPQWDVRPVPEHIQREVREVMAAVKTKRQED